MAMCMQVHGVSPHSKYAMRIPSHFSPSLIKHTSRISFSVTSCGVHSRCCATSISTQKRDMAETDSFFALDSRPIMLFDGVCNLCNGGVKFVRDNDPNKNIRYVPLQSEAGRKLLVRSGRSPNDISSVVLVEKDRSFIRSEAVLRILTYLDFPYPQLTVFLYLVPLLVRDAVYDSVANNRYVVFGKTTSCEISDSLL